MPRFLLAALVFSLLIFAGGGSYQAQAAATPRNIPWDCSDWQAAAAIDDAEDARVSVILESLATNRGKTLYCAIDQSDTFTKAETWQAGRDRNERDDTVYQGQNGRFRGFLAAQEGYLTDGESGVTGISRDRIFEFPEEPKKKRRYRTVVETLDIAAHSSRLAMSPWAHQTFLSTTSESTAKTNATNIFNGVFPAHRYSPCRNSGNCTPAQWAEWGQQAATDYCRSLGYKKAVDTATLLSTDVRIYSENRATLPNHAYQVRKTRQYTTTCERTKRVRR